MNPRVQGPMFGIASCHFELAVQEAIAGMIALSEAGLEPGEAMAAAVDELAEISSAVLQIADDFAAAETARRFRVAA